MIKIFRRKKRNKTDTNEPPDDTELNLENDIPYAKIEYQGSSPDEKALVEAAYRVGVMFIGEEGNTLRLKFENEVEIYERLQIIEFTSERRRMSVIVKDKNGKVSK